MLSKPLLNELKTIMSEDYGKDLSDQEVSQIANTLVGYFDVLAEIAHRVKRGVENPDLLPDKEQIRTLNLIVRGRTRSAS